MCTFIAALLSEAMIWCQFSYLLVVEWKKRMLYTYIIIIKSYSVIKIMKTCHMQQHKENGGHNGKWNTSHRGDKCHMIFST